MLVRKFKKQIFIKNLNKLIYYFLMIIYKNISLKYKNVENKIFVDILLFFETHLIKHNPESHCQLIKLLYHKIHPLRIFIS